MSINSWPTEERPREKMIQKGAQALSDAELLAIFLRTGVHGHSAIDIGRKLISKYNGLNGIFSANIKDIQKTLGIGPSKAVTIKAITELAARYLKQRSTKKSRLKTVELIKLAKMEMSTCEEEVLAVIFLDIHHQLISIKKITQGNINEIKIHARKIIAACLSEQASQIILVHNHPSGNPKPSQKDVLITQQIRCIMLPFQIYVIDHIITTRETGISMVKEKYIEPLSYYES